MGFVIFRVKVITGITGIFWLVSTSLLDHLGALVMHMMGKLLELFKRGGGGEWGVKFAT